MATCRDCKFWDIEAAKNKRGYVMKTRAAKCTWVSREQWPASVYLSTRPSPGHMCADYGKGCPCFQWREMKCTG